MQAQLNTAITTTTGSSTTATAMNGEARKADDVISYFLCKKVSGVRNFLAKSSTLVDARIALKEHLATLNYLILPDANPVHNKEKPINHGQSFLVQKTDAMKSKYLDEWLEYCNFVHQNKPSSFWTNSEPVTTYTPILVSKYSIMQICGPIPTFPAASIALEAKSGDRFPTWSISDSAVSTAIPVQIVTATPQKLPAEKPQQIPIATSYKRPTPPIAPAPTAFTPVVVSKVLPTKKEEKVEPGEGKEMKVEVVVPTVAESAQQISKRALNMIKSIYSVETASCLNFNVFSEVATLSSKMSIDDTNELISWAQTVQSHRRYSNMVMRADLYNLVGYVNYFVLSNSRASIECFRIAANLGYPLAMYYLISIFEENDNWANKFAASNYRTPYN